MATYCEESYDFFVKRFRNSLLFCFLPPPLSNLRPHPLSARHSSRYSHNVRFSIPCSGKENGLAIQSIQEQATSFTFIKFSVKNKTFPTLMTLNKCPLKVYPSFSDERLEG